MTTVYVMGSLDDLMAVILDTPGYVDHRLAAAQAHRQQVTHSDFFELQLRFYEGNWAGVLRDIKIVFGHSSLSLQDIHKNLQKSLAPGLTLNI